MIKVSFRFHAELNDFLPSEQRNRPISILLNNRPAVKDTIESIGIPHTEVDVILVNGESVDFSYQLQTGDRISVYPFSRSPRSETLNHLQPPLARSPKFVLDTHLGRLASYLRMLGFDALYRNDFADNDLATISHRENRYLLTRDRGLLKRSMVTRGYLLRSTNSHEQLQEVIERFNLHNAVRPFLRCMACNGNLIRVEKEEIKDRLEPETQKYYDDFFICTQCGNLYWKGSHYRRMQRFIQQILEHNPG